jgi:excisionase family DNA binding protein
MTSFADLPVVLTVEETAELLRIGRSAAYAAVRSGDIPCVKVGRSIRVPKHRLEQLLGPINESSRAGKPGSTKSAGGISHGQSYID